MPSQNPELRDRNTGILNNQDWDTACRFTSADFRVLPADVLIEASAAVSRRVSELMGELEIATSVHTSISAYQLVRLKQSRSGTRGKRGKVQ